MIMAYDAAFAELGLFNEDRDKWVQAELYELAPKIQAATFVNDYVATRLEGLAKIARFLAEEKKRSI